MNFIQIDIKNLKIKLNIFFSLSKFLALNFATENGTPYIFQWLFSYCLSIVYLKYSPFNIF